MNDTIIYINRVTKLKIIKKQSRIEHLEKQ